VRARGGFVESAPHLGRRRRRCEIAASVANDDPVPRAEDRAGRQAAEIASVERRVGGDDQHAGPIRRSSSFDWLRTSEGGPARTSGGRAPVRRLQASEDRHAPARQVAAEVGLRQHANGVFTLALRLLKGELARRVPCHLSSVTHRPVPAPTLPSATGQSSF
jgi:hypothetical protein